MNDSGGGVGDPLPADEGIEALARRVQGEISVPGYRALALIGRGGQGAVYRAVQESTGRTVALKVIGRSEVSGAAFERFKRERDLICLLRHPHVVSVLDAGVAGERQFLVMEFVDGPTLEDWLVERGPLDREQAASLLLPLCDAVAHAHRQGVTHRDLKPHNVLMQRNEDSALGWTPKITDFGLARVLEGVDPHFVTARNQDRMSTYAYSAPELLGEAVAPPDTRIDVFGLGALLYRSLAGHDPRQGLTHDEASAMRGVAPYRSIARLRRDGRPVGHDLEAIAFRALAPNPDERYPTVQELSLELRRFLDGRPVLAMPRRWSYVLGKSVLRYRTAWGLGAAAVVLAAIGLTAWIVQAEHTRQQSLRVSGAMTAHAREVDEIFRNLLDPLKDALGSSAPALAMARQMVASRERMIAEDPENLGLIEGLYQFHEAIGDLLMAEARHREALPEFEAALRLLNEHFDLADDSMRARIANALRAKSADAIKAWDKPAALALYEQVLTDDRARLAANQDHADVAQFADDLAWSLQRVAGLLFDASCAEPDSELASRLEDLVKECVGLHPYVAQDSWRALDVQLVENMLRATLLQCSHYDPETWVAQLYEGEQLAEQLQVNGSPSAHYDFLLLSRSYVHALKLLYAKDPSGVAAADTLFAKLDRMVERSPENVDFRVLKAGTMRQYARIALGQPELAEQRRAWLEESLRLHEQIGESHPNWSDYWNQVACLHLQLAVENAPSDVEESIQHFAAARTMLETRPIVQTWPRLADTLGWICESADGLAIESEQYWAAHRAFLEFVAQQRSSAEEGN